MVVSLSLLRYYTVSLGTAPRPLLPRRTEERLGPRHREILDQLEALGQVPQTVDEPRDLGPLEAPVEPVFRVGAIGLAWDSGRRSVQLELFSVELGDKTEDEDADRMVQIWLTPRQAREFALRTEVIVASGRPACPFCSQPINEGGHICPRSNGYRGPLF